jgi:hypothetical protein
MANRRLRSVLEWDEYLPVALTGHLRYPRSTTSSDRVPIETPPVKSEEPDLHHLETRILTLIEMPSLTDTQRDACKAYLNGMAMIKRGKDPDGFPGIDV